MLYIRGNRRDFDKWKSLGNPGWGYEDVLPFFKKSQDQRNPYLARNTKYHSTGPFSYIYRAFLHLLLCILFKKKRIIHPYSSRARARV